MLTSDCLEMAVARYEEEYPVEEPTEEALEPRHEIESDKRTEESSNTDSKMQIKENGKEMILKSLHEELAYLEEELRENEIIQELKQDIIAMEQVIDAVDYRTCECILEYYDCTSSLDEINSIKKCDSTLSGEEIRILCEQCEDRARTIYGHLRDY